MIVNVSQVIFLRRLHKLCKKEMKTLSAIDDQ